MDAAGLLFNNSIITFWCHLNLKLHFFVSVQSRLSRPTARVTPPPPSSHPPSVALTGLPLQTSESVDEGIKDPPFSLSSLDADVKHLQHPEKVELSLTVGLVCESQHCR